MRILCPELQLCYGNWKTEYLCRANFSGWWRNHGIKYLQVPQKANPPKEASLTPSASSTASATPSASSMTGTDPSTSPSGPLKRTRDDSDPGESSDLGTSTDMDGQDKASDLSLPPIKRSKTMSSRRKRIELFGSKIDIPKISEPISLEPNQGVSSATPVTAPTSTNMDSASPGSGSLPAKPGLPPLLIALKSQEHPVPAAMGGITPTSSTRPSVAEEHPTRAAEPPAIAEPSTIAVEPPTITAGKQVKKKATPRRPPAPKTDKRNEILKIPSHD
ncbi:hypothetical protein PQX77_015757 [Marasmius sp. AFHP31]|nr:hypothetical protein PQX77_015757 [Marasmius sp. AFHP31]